MGAAIRAELRKFFTTRMWWGMAIAVFAVGAALAAVFALVVPGQPVAPGINMPGLDNPAMVRMTYTGGASMASALTMVIGIFTIGAEYRHKTITSTFLAVPKRARVMGAKGVALLVIGAMYALISMLGSVLVGGTIIVLKGHSPFPDASVARALALTLLALGLWALVGLGVGILIPNQVAAMLVSLGVVSIIEPILSAVLPLVAWGKAIVPYFPSQATSAMVQPVSLGLDTAPMLSWWGGTLMLMAYAVVFAGIGTLLTLKRDVT